MACNAPKRPTLPLLVEILFGVRRLGKSGLEVLTLFLVTTACTEGTGTDVEQPDELASDIASVSARQSYSIESLPGLPRSSFPLGVNNSGTIVGWLRTASGDMRAFRWQNGSVTELPGLGGPTSSAEDINERGIIVGHADDEDGYPRAVMWQASRVVDLGTLGGRFSFATAINDRGQVVGGSGTSGGTVHAFLLSRGKMTDLGRLPGSELSRAEDLNNRGAVVGWSAGGAFIQRATLWQDGTAVDLGTLGNESGAFSVNPRGQIVGASIEETEAQAVIWERGEMRELGTLGGTFSSAHAIDAAGRVIGVSSSGDGWQTAFLWRRGTMIDIGRREGALSNPFAMNARGTIVGFSDGPVVWTPTRPGRPSQSAGPAYSRIVPDSRQAAGERPDGSPGLCGSRATLAGRPHGVDVAGGC